MLHCTVYRHHAMCQRSKPTNIPTSQVELLSEILLNNIPHYGQPNTNRPALGELNVPLSRSTSIRSIFSTRFSNSYSADAAIGSMSSFLRSYSITEYVENTFIQTFQSMPFHSAQIKPHNTCDFSLRILRKK